jgi:hypothetical protein
MTTKQHNLHLTDDEREALIDTLQSVLKDLSYEIADTDSFDFREGIKAKRDLITKVVSQLEAS